MECKQHKNPKCFKCLKKAVDELLHNTNTSGNGGFVSQFGVLLFDRLKYLTTPTNKKD